MHGRTLRSLPKSVMNKDRKIPYDLGRVDEMQHDAMILWIAKDVLHKYGFHGYGSSIDKIAAHVSNGGVDPVYPRAGRWGLESKGRTVHCYGCGEEVPHEIAYRDGSRPFHWNEQGGGHTCEARAYSKEERK